MNPGQQEQYKIPPELERHPPRPVRRRRGTLGIPMVVGRLVAIFLLAFGFSQICDIALTIAIIMQGQSLPGQVQKTWRTPSGERYYVRFTYEAGGRVHIGSRTISSGQYEQFFASPATQPALPIKVRAMPIAGFYFRQMYLPGEWLWGPVFGVLKVMAQDALVTWILIYATWILQRRQKRLCRDGTPISGRIVRLRTFSNKATSYQVDYQFDHPRLGTQTKRILIQPKRWKPAEVGEPVSILCYPHKKGPTVIYEYSDFECL